MTCAQAKAARNKAQHDERYLGTRKNADVAARRLSEKIAKERAFNVRKGQKAKGGK